jgi:uncharacterized membrane protein YqjE
MYCVIAGIVPGCKLQAAAALRGTAGELTLQGIAFAKFKTMSDAHSRLDDKSLGNLIKELAEDLSTLVRSEVALAKLELRQTAANVGVVSALFAGAVFCALAALAFLLVTAVLALAEVIAPWLSALIVAVVMLLSAVVLALVGKKKIQKVEFVPTATVESMKTNVESIKADLSRLKREAS